MNEHENLGELMDFLHANGEWTLDPVTGGFLFDAVVTYCASRTVSFKTRVRVQTDAQSNGKISLDETSKCPASAYHLDFYPRWQTMRFDRDSNLLVVSGRSDKMGDYKVTILAEPR
ncbi:MAG: hypothetical protein QOK24_2735 [Verrucomicrobiota bacterium]|jgi:hypothetical protein